METEIVSAMGQQSPVGVIIVTACSIAVAFALAGIWGLKLVINFQKQQYESLEKRFSEERERQEDRHRRENESVEGRRAEENRRFIETLERGFDSLRDEIRQMRREAA